MPLVYRGARALPNLNGVNILFCEKDFETCAKDCVSEGCKDLVLVTLEQDCAEKLSIELRKVLYRMGWKFSGD